MRVAELHQIDVAKMGRQRVRNTSKNPAASAPSAFTYLGSN